MPTDPGPLAELDDPRAPPALGFAARPVERALIEEILAVARRAPSGVNTQPWNVFVLRDRALAGLVTHACAAVAQWGGDPQGEAMFWEQFARMPGIGQWPAPDAAHCGDTPLSAAFGAAHRRPAGAARDMQPLLRYFRFFDAPVGLLFTVSATLGLGSVLDYGMFLQNVALAARARGLQACLQTGWRGMAPQVLPRLNPAPDMLLLCGMALGYADPEQPPIGDAPAVPSASAFTTWRG